MQQWDGSPEQQLNTKTSIHSYITARDLYKLIVHWTKIQIFTGTKFIRINMYMCVPMHVVVSMSSSLYTCVCMYVCACMCIAIVIDYNTIIIMNCDIFVHVKFYRLH